MLEATYGWYWAAGVLAATRAEVTWLTSGA
jgi:hypothetical protein